MSNFACEYCGTPSIDSRTGYVGGCKHHPPERTGLFAVTLLTGENILCRWIEDEFRDDKNREVGKYKSWTFIDQ